MNVEEKIIEQLNRLRPYLVNDGGNIEFVKFENGTVYVKFLGACSHCGMLDVTLTEGIAATLINEIPEVKSVEKID